jgi:hypothetical protein
MTTRMARILNQTEQEPNEIEAMTMARPASPQRGILQDWAQLNMVANLHRLDPTPEQHRKIEH